jgi:hypothetical protein
MENENENRNTNRNGKGKRGCRGKKLTPQTLS